MALVAKGVVNSRQFVSRRQGRGIRRRGREGYGGGYVQLRIFEFPRGGILSLSFSPISTEREQISCPPLAHNVISKTRDSSRQEEGGRLISSFFEEAKKRPVVASFFPLFFAKDTCNASITSPDCYSFDAKKLYRRLYKVVRKGERFIASRRRGEGGRERKQHARV